MSPKKPKADAAPEEIKRHHLQRYELQEVKRSQLKNAPYNPRILSDAARDKLRGGIKKLGLIEAPVWNKRTGNLVGGHQRLKLLDAEANGVKDYLLTVAVVDLNETEEIEANILLNNAEAQGEYDLAKLDQLLRKPGLRLEATGFDMGDIYQLLGDTPVSQNFPAEAEKLADSLGGIKEQVDKGLGEIHAARDNQDFFLVVVFKDDDDRKAFTDALGLDDNRFQDGRRLHKLLTKTDGEDAQGEGTDAAAGDAGGNARDTKPGRRAVHRRKAPADSSAPDRG